MCPLNPYGFDCSSSSQTSPFLSTGWHLPVFIPGYQLAPQAVFWILYPSFPSLQSPPPESSPCSVLPSLQLSWPWPPVSVLPSEVPGRCYCPDSNGPSSCHLGHTYSSIPFPGETPTVPHHHLRLGGTSHREGSTAWSSHLFHHLGR